MWAYAIPCEKGAVSYRYFGDKKHVELHMLDYAIVPVVLTESSKGKYYGWLDAKEDVPSLVWNSRFLFEMCFPGGAEICEKRGDGRVVRMSVSPVR